MPQRPAAELLEPFAFSICFVHGSAMPRFRPHEMPVLRKVLLHQAAQNTQTTVGSIAVLKP
jgi:hypothetical protein